MFSAMSAKFLNEIYYHNKSLWRLSSQIKSVTLDMSYDYTAIYRHSVLVNASVNSFSI